MNPVPLIVATALILAVTAGAWAGRFVAPANAPGPTTVRVVRADPVAHARLSAVIARLDRARVAGRAALKRARTRSAQAALVRRLREAHRRSAASLDTAHGALTRALRTTGRAYGTLAAAASDGSPARFDAARRRARAAETTLAAAVEDARAPRVVRTAASPKPSADWTDPTRLLVLAIVMVIIAAAGASVSGVANRPAAAARRLPRGSAGRLTRTSGT